MNRIEKVVDVLSVDYRNTSYYGNPSYFVAFTDEEKNYERGYTGANNMCGYSAKNFLKRKCKITYHYTKSGKCVIDFMSNP